jgi:hypothetical protein
MGERDRTAEMVKIRAANNIGVTNCTATTVGAALLKNETARFRMYETKAVVFTTSKEVLIFAGYSHTHSSFRL